MSADEEKEEGRKIEAGAVFKGEGGLRATVEVVSSSSNASFEKIAIEFSKRIRDTAATIRSDEKEDNS